MRSGDELEIDLYNELTSFSVLSPQEREADEARLRKNPSPPPPTPVMVEPTPPSPVYPKGPRNYPAGPEADSFNLMTIQGGQIVIEQVLLDDLEEAAGADMNLAGAKEQNQYADRGVVGEPVKAGEEISPPAAEPAEIDKADDASLEMGEPLKVTGSLSDPSSPAPDSWTALILCRACGNEADSREMFCVACGGFLDDPRSQANSQVVCADCGSVVENDQIFCPSCGSVLIAE